MLGVSWDVRVILLHCRFGRTGSVDASRQPFVRVGRPGRGRGRRSSSRSRRCRCRDAMHGAVRRLGRLRLPARVVGSGWPRVPWPSRLGFGLADRAGAAAVDEPGRAASAFAHLRSEGRSSKSSTRATRPRVSRSSVAALRPRPGERRHEASRTRPDETGASQATARCGRSSKTEPTSGVRIEPGPTSTNTRAPSRCIASIMSANRTGPAR